VLDPGSAVKAFGENLPEGVSDTIASRSTATVTVVARTNDLSVLLVNWEATLHCLSVDGCINCAGTGGNSCKTASYACPTYTYYFPQCCGTFNCATNTFSGGNTCGLGGQPSTCTLCCSPY
jgi:hypothetical protein